MYANKLFLCALGAVGVARAISLQVSTSGGNASSPLLYGMMFEDINHSGDGGIHAQLLQNNGFQGTNPNASAYAPVGDVDISEDSGTPLSAAIRSSLKVTVPEGATGKIGFLNHGYNGVPVNKDTYFSAFYMKGNYKGDVIISLKGGSGDAYASQNVTVNSGLGNFTYYELSLEATASPDGNNWWQLEFLADKVAGTSLWFDLIQLYPTTYHSRPNGLRADIAKMMEDMSPSFLRFPGGNNLEGATVDNRWIWNKTIGPLMDRPGREGAWKYPNTDALGLMEYLYWSVDMKLQPVLGVWAGMPLNDPPLTGSALKPYIGEVLDELEFVLGDASTTFGAMRAKLGQEAPFKVNMVEIGNEDNLNQGCSSYASRFMDFYNAIHAKYPSLRIIASTTNTTCLPPSLPQGVWTDMHHYESPDSMVRLFNEWDNTPRSNDYGIFVGEYACLRRDDDSVLDYPEMQGSIAEAVYLIGLERNSDLVKMAAYAPLLEHQGLRSWSPNLIVFDSSPGSLTGSTSYYVQKLFSNARGSTILPVKADGNFNPLFWTASATSGGSPTYFVKVANYGGEAQNVTVSIPGLRSNQIAALHSVSAGQTDSNQPHSMKVQTQTTRVLGNANSGFIFTMPGWAAAVLCVDPA